ncbi:hypothetical protein ACI77J_08955 [Pseudomonas sp. O64]|uniref:hypothetical protein n=1 Tax=Pseudomonas TaxID=286 RepID=UPI000BA01842|nr:MULTISPECIES: hypothetical protein [unclassified Pseudomonas]MCV2230160.1 hypothetical protein [Pseudomonas sp. AU10]OZO06309.1 hypothetical protein B7453_01195 [Pseudomonas sp. IB20]UNM20804.1 hypothetical protein K0P33_04860 [Pseudomonas sp. ArH3a]UXZ23593.1 hypothetical protein KZH41_05035 [Pseudomonas sp. YeP6b]
MNGDTRVLNSFYRQQARSEKDIASIGSDSSYSGEIEDTNRFLELLNEEKAKLINNYAVSSTYLSFKHETIKSSINVV